MSDARDRDSRPVSAAEAVAADPTLAAPPGTESGHDAVAERRFPDAVEGPRLVLFQRVDGAVELRWRLDLTALAHARAAFADDAHPHASLLLKAFDGGPHAVAGADLDEGELPETGAARFDAAQAEGPLQAEIGLADGAGGWILTARSNRLEAIGPVGVDFLREEAGWGSRSVADAIDEETHPEATGPAEGEGAIQSLPPEFPLVPPKIDSSSASAGDAAETPSAEVEAAADREADAPVGSGPAALAEGAAEAPLLPEARHDRPLPGDRAAPAGDPGGLLRDMGVILSGAENAGIAEPGAAGDAGVEGSAVLLTPTEPAVAPPPEAEEPRATTLGGSGPIRPPRPGQGIELTAELIVYGSAPPGQLIELGGHRYRVGPGGRFLLRVPVTDRRLIEAALARLEHLPVPARDADEHGG